jgi:hypothetical protein
VVAAVVGKGGAEILVGGNDDNGLSHHQSGRGWAKMGPDNFFADIFFVLVVAAE